MKAIVTYAHRYKRPPRKRAEAAQITGPAVVSSNKQSGKFSSVPDLTAEEHRRRGDAAEALFRELTKAARQHRRSQPNR